MRKAKIKQYFINISVFFILISLVNPISVQASETNQYRTVSIGYSDSYLDMTFSDTGTLIFKGEGVSISNNFCIDSICQKIPVVGVDFWTGNVNTEIDLASYDEGIHHVFLSTGISGKVFFDFEIINGNGYYLPDEFNKINLDFMDLLSTWDPEVFTSTTANELRFSEIYFQEVMDKAIEITKNATSDYERIQLIYSWLIDNLEYDYDYLPGSYHPYTAFTSGFAVCQGYADLAQAMLRLIGIPTITLSGRTQGAYGWSENSNHAWNISYADGEWILFDATWGDTTEQILFYFNQRMYDFSGSKSIDEYHIPSEHLALIETQSFVSRFYELVLNRTTDPWGLNDWTTKLLNGERSGADVAYGFVLSDEFKAKNLNNDLFVKTLYRAFFGREADIGGYNDWMNRLASGQTREQVLKGFLGSAEFRDLCTKYGINPGI